MKKQTTIQPSAAAQSTAFRKFFIDELKDILWAEKHLTQALKKMQKAATSPALADAFAAHVEESQGQIERLNHVFEMLDKTPQAKKCDAMAGLVSEAEQIIEDTERDSYTRDAGLILAAQKAEHYEIATYGTLACYARLMGEMKVAEELESILSEEKKTDTLLTTLTDEAVADDVEAVK